MKGSLRFRAFLWMAAVLAVYFLFYTIAHFAFNRFEIREGHNPMEEFEEFLILVSVGLLMFPVVLALAWDVTRRMLRPVRSMAETAQRISEGSLAERIPVPETADEMESLARTLNGAFDRFQVAVRRLEQFSSDASHQLRNPLMGLRGAGEIALQRDRTPLEYRETIAGMLEEAGRLNRVVNQLLAMARLDAARLRSDFSPQDAADIARRAMTLRRSQASAKNLKMEEAAPAAVPVTANRTLIMEAVANLLDNAIRHSPEGGTITVEVRTERDQAVISVLDQGPGIPADQLSVLFARFRRGDHVDQHGTGIGLSIASEIMHLHHGELSARNRPEGGAEFTLRLPLADSPRSTRPGIVAADDPAPRPGAFG
jgi:heavy metal sensor kinase